MANSCRKWVLQLYIGKMCTNIGGQVICANIHKPSLQKFVNSFHSILCYPYVGEFVLIIMLVKIIKLQAMYNKYIKIYVHIPM